MAKKAEPANFIEELARFIASRPSRDELLDFHPSSATEQRAEELLLKQNEGRIGRDEQLELEEFAHAERLMRLVKAYLRDKRISRS